MLQPRLRPGERSADRQPSRRSRPSLPSRPRPAGPPRWQARARRARDLGRLVLAGAVAFGAACEPSPSPSAASPPAVTPPTSASPAASTSPSAPPASPTPSPPPVSTTLVATTYPSRVAVGRPGGSVTIADWREPAIFNFYYQRLETEAELAATYFNGLVVATDDFRYMPDLASEVPTLENGGVTVPGTGGAAMTTTWQLRDGLRWSDGMPLTCEDVRFTWQWVTDDANVGIVQGREGWDLIESIECPDARTIVIDWSAVYPGYVGLVAAVLPRHYLEPIPVATALTDAYLAEDLPSIPVSGPFRAAGVAAGQGIQMIRNDQYRGPGGRAAHLDELAFRWYPTPAALVAGYRAAEFDVGKGLDNVDLPAVADLGDAVRRQTGLAYELHRPNWASPVMGDPAVRLAYRLALDKVAINAQVLGGSAVLTESATSPSAWFAAATPPVGAQDLERARRVLDEAGWRDANGDGVREKDGVEARIRLCTTQAPFREQTLGLTVGWLAEIGLAARVEAVTATDMFAPWGASTDRTPCNLAHGAFDVAEHRFLPPLDPLANYATYHSSQVEPEGVNDAAVRDADVDAVLDRLRATVDFDEVKAAMAEFHALYDERTIEIPLYFRDNVWLVNPRVQNFTGNPTGQGAAWNVGDWFVTP